MAVRLAAVLLAESSRFDQRVESLAVALLLVRHDVSETDSTMSPRDFSS